MRVVNRSIFKLEPNPEKTLRHNHKHISRIAKSIKENGFNNPIIIDREFNILEGHARFEAAILLEMPKVPTLMLDKKTPAQARAEINDNPYWKNSKWDWDSLSFDLFNLIDLHIEVIPKPMEEGDYDLLENLKTGEIKKNSLRAFMKKFKAYVMKGQTWRMGNHRIHVVGKQFNHKRLFDTLEAINDKQIIVLCTSAQAETMLYRWDEKGRGDIELTNEGIL